MNAFLSVFALAVAASPAAAIFDPITLTGVGSIGASALTGGGAVLTAGTGTAFLTTAGVAAAGLGLLGAAVVAGAFAGRALGGRGKRDLGSVAALQVILKFDSERLKSDMLGRDNLRICMIKTTPAISYTCSVSGR